VSIEDLLGRDPVTLDWRSISDGVAGKTVLVTGGGGSIGAELCRQVARLGPSALVVFENGEFNLFRVERELRRSFPDLVLHARLGDVRETEAVRFAFTEYQPDIVFHAAAYKHVPMLQDQTREAVRNNVLGTRNVAQTAAAFGCEAFVLISTDKAVNPTNVMGATKRVAEIVCQNLNGQGRTRFITVRFGNVLDSAGSVVPTFREQIAAGGPVTVTHPDITRYFMTIPEASQLILQAAVAGKGGEIFVLDMGEPVRIRDLAEQMIRLSGKQPGVDVPIVFTGLRPGEKLYEELFHEEERLAPTGQDKLRLAHVREVDQETLDRSLEEMEAACAAYDEQRLLDLLKVLVPEFGEARRGGGERAPSNVVALDRARR
jgi:FlaA1/EpsC-like NDP-sugar epimerase